MTIPDVIYATRTRSGRMWVQGVDSDGQRFGFPLDPMVLAELAPHMAEAAVTALRLNRHTDGRKKRDDQRGQEGVS